MEETLSQNGMFFHNFVQNHGLPTKDIYTRSNPPGLFHEVSQNSFIWHSFSIIRTKAFLSAFPSSPHMPAL